MPILLLIFVVLVLLLLALYICNLIPLPSGSPEFTKPVLMILCAAAAFIVIAERAGLLR